MRFKEVKKHSNYKEWLWNDPKTSCIVKINLLPVLEHYHFKICCNERYCKSHNPCGNAGCKHKLNYSSLSSGDTYETFEECEDGIAIWFYNNKDNLFCPLR